MRKILFLMLSLSVILFSCKSQPKEKQAEKPAVVQPVVVEPVVTQPETKGVYTVVCPANMKKIDPLMATKLNAIAEEIKATKPESITVVGHSAKLNSEREERLAAEREIKLIVDSMHCMALMSKLRTKGLRNRLLHITTLPFGNRTDVL